MKLRGERSSFPQWKELLLDLARDTRFEAKVDKFLTAGDYENAASVIDRERPTLLTRRICDAFDRQIEKEQVLQGAVAYLPFLVNGPVITTNYDTVLEQAFEAAGRRFERVIPGPFVDATVAAVHSNERALIKIHGDCRDRQFQVLTVKQYEDAYGSMNLDSPVTRADIGSLTWLLFTNRPLLFLGCSLAQDRTVSALRAVRRQLHGLNHYAVVAAEPSREAWQRREEHLEELGIRVLWFMPGEFKEIERLLGQALEAASTRPLPPPTSTHEPRRSTAQPANLDEVASGLAGNASATEGATSRPRGHQ